MNEQHMKLVTETEKLNLKSEFDVKVDILSKENNYLKEERKKMIKDYKDITQKYEFELKSRQDELERVKQELLLFKRENTTKEQLIEDNSMLKLQVQNTRMQIEKVILDNESLVKQLQMLKRTDQFSQRQMPNLSDQKQQSRNQEQYDYQAQIGQSSGGMELPLQLNSNSSHHSHRNSNQLYSPQINRQRVP